MSEKPIARQIAEIGESLKLKDIDKRTIENAKIFMLDTLGCMLSGSQIQSAKSVRAAALNLTNEGEATIFGSGKKTNAMLAALANGTAGHSQDYDDDHREGIQHASVAVLPAVLALAEKHKKSGRDVLLAYIYGSDITIRAGEAFLGTTYYSGWHPTGTCGVFGATGGACKVLGLNADQTTNALGVAGSEAAGLGEFNQAGAWTKRFHAGHSAMGGVLASYMGEQDYFGPATVFEGRHGFLNGFSFKGTKEDPHPEGIYDAAKLTVNFGKKWEMADNSIKLHACCRFSNNLCDCAIDIFKQGCDFNQIESIHADVNQFTEYNLCYPEDLKRHPVNPVNAQFSLFYEIACGLVKGAVLPESFTEQAIKDERIARLSDLITWKVDPEFEAVYPERYPARVTVKTKDGKIYVGEVQYPKGDPEYPATKEEVTFKFLANAANTIGSVKAKRICELVDHIETLENIDELISCMY
ncbi:MmgE/PrpD family protein [Dehalobacter sp. DCM]|uniref:MmgE/PrpD family protein n=1 Tax=Dehalobacter sp. DCM TaxID=2907827 RepID=UPI0030818655|nr:MmgE/PrpD family protein [Dehalobacter sp. DCM]